jgi:choline dehydrogenase
MGAFVHRLVVHHGRCAGVEYRCGGQRHHAQAEGEVVLCAGAIDSPRLLLLSGIGDPKQLSGLGIEPVTGLPGVGHNFHDHVLLRGICVEARQPIPPATGNLGEAVLYWRSDARLTGPNLQIVLVYAPFYNPWQKATSNAYTFAVAHMRPASRGRLSLVSSDPRDRPRIDPNYLSDRHDLEMLIEGVQKAVELSAQPAFAEWRGGDAISSIGAAEPRTLADFVKSGVSTFNHAVGTCRMGVDEYSVVDPQLKVHDLEGLRVADASVMPSVTTTNTNAATIMIGEKTADLIRQESGHVPVVVSPGPD